MGIVDVTLIVIVEDIVGFLDGFESDLCFFAFAFGNFIGVVRKGGLLSVQGQMCYLVTS